MLAWHRGRKLPAPKASPSEAGWAQKGINKEIVNILSKFNFNKINLIQVDSFEFDVMASLYVESMWIQFELKFDKNYMKLATLFYELL